ncbi:MAG: N-acetylmuramoyl-L-alanine amidase [Pseudomonadota bacterium]
MAKRRVASVGLRALGAAVLALSALAAAADSARLNGVRVYAAPDYTRVVLDSDRPLDYRLKRGARTLSLRLDNLPPAARFDLDAVNLVGSALDDIRYAPGAGQRTRLQIESGLALTPRVFRIEPVGSYGHRLVLDLYPERHQRAAPLKQRKANRDVLIAIDAGHGGEDPGALAAGGVREADVVLSIAQRLARLIDAQRGMRALLLRTGDYYVSRDQRVVAARAARADLLLSVHADAVPQEEVVGASVYTLSSGGASSEIAAWLGRKDSRSDLLGGVSSDVVLKDKDATLAKVLLDLSLDAQRNASLKLADAVLAALGEAVALHRATPDQASFVVLKAPDIPSILVETGFLSNPAEAQRLRQTRYQQRVARAIANGVTSYVSANPPPGTLLAQRARKPRAAGPRRHVISSGDSLSEVAVLYGVSTASLRRANKLDGDRLQIGQVLVIPDA